MEKLWTTSEVAQFLGIADADVQELVRQGKLTGYKLGGQFLRFRPAQVESLKQQVRFRNTARRPVTKPADPWLRRVRDFVYFYDFYLVSATCLAILIIYLIAS